MKLLFIESYPHVMFGQQRILLALLAAISRKNVQCLVGCTGKGVFAEEVHRQGYQVINLPYPNSLASYGGAIYRYRGRDKLRCYAQGLGYLWNLRKQLKKLKPGAVFCNDMRGLLTVGVAARTLGIPVMIWDKLEKPHGWLDWIQLPIATCNPIITSSILGKYPKWQQRWYRKKIHRIPDGADLNEYDRGKEIRKNLPGNETDVLVGIAGTITERKGHDRLLKAFPKILDRAAKVRILIIGEVSGSKEDDFFRAALPYQDHERVHFLGMREDMPDLMKSLDILVIPSRYEGLGLVTVEAMAASKPVVGARAGGIPEVIEDGETGLIFDGDSEEQLIDALVTLALDPALRQRMGQAGRERVEKLFNRPVQMGKVIDLLEELAIGGR